MTHPELDDDGTDWIALAESFVAQIEGHLAQLAARSPAFRRLRYSVFREALEIEPARCDAPAAVVEIAVNREPDVTPDVAPALAAIAWHTRRGLLAVDLSRRRKVEPRVGGPGLEGNGGKERATIHRQRDMAAASMSSCRSRRTP